MSRGILDPVPVVAITGTLLSTIQIARNVARLLKAGSDIDDPRIRLIQGKLRNERRLTVAWANRIRLESADGWDLPTESVAEIETILQQMRMSFERAKAKMVKTLQEPGGKMTTRVFMRRFWFANGGFEDLHDLTNVLATMNRKLMLIAPPLPQFSSLNIPAGVQPDSTIANTASMTPAEVTELDIPDSQGPGKSQASLYSMCLEVLALIAREMPHDLSVRNLHARLDLWGQGLFGNDSISLNAISESDPEGTEMLLAATTRALVYIAVIEERILAYLDEQKTESQRSIENQRTEVNEMLGREAFIDLALQNWVSLQAASVNSSLPGDIHLIQQEVSIPAEQDTPVNEQRSSKLSNRDIPESKFEAGVDVNHLDDIERETKELERLVMNSVAHNSSPEAESVTESASTDLARLKVSGADEVKPEAFDLLSRTIELLFDLLPAIRSVRRARLLEIESEETAHVPSTAEAANWSISRNLIDEQLELTIKGVKELETLLKNDESWAKENGQQVKIYTPILRKERERLEEYRQARKRRKGLLLDVNKVLLAIAKLNRQLRKTTHDIEVKGETGMHIKGIKFSDVDTNRKIGNAVAALKASSTLFWNDFPPDAS